MKEPVKPREPWAYDYDAKVERRYIYNFHESLNEDEDYYEPEDYDEEYHGTREKPTKDASQVTLAWLLGQLPEGITPDMVKMDFGFHASSMAFEDHHVGFYYEVTIPARKKELKAAQKQYEAELAQYNRDMEVYRAWGVQEEIRKTEEKLAKLKGNGQKVVVRDKSGKVIGMQG